MVGFGSIGVGKSQLPKDRLGRNIVKYMSAKKGTESSLKYVRKTADLLQSTAPGDVPDVAGSEMINALMRLWEFVLDNVDKVGYLQRDICCDIMGLLALRKEFQFQSYSGFDESAANFSDLLLRTHKYATAPRSQTVGALSSVTVLAARTLAVAYSRVPRLRDMIRSSLNPIFTTKLECSKTYLENNPGFVQRLEDINKGFDDIEKADVASASTYSTARRESLELMRSQQNQGKAWNAHHQQVPKRSHASPLASAASPPGSPRTSRTFTEGDHFRTWIAIDATDTDLQLESGWLEQLQVTHGALFWLFLKEVILYCRSHQEDVIPWSLAVPGYWAMARRLMGELTTSETVDSYSHEAMVALVGTNLDLFNLFMRGVLYKTHIWDAVGTQQTLKIVDDYLLAVKKNPDGITWAHQYMDAHLLYRAIFVLFTTEHFAVLSQSLLLVYNHLELFNPLWRFWILSKLFEEHFFRLFFHWDEVVQNIFFHLITFRSFTTAAARSENAPHLIAMGAPFIAKENGSSQAQDIKDLSMSRPVVCDPRAFCFVSAETPGTQSPKRGMLRGDNTRMICLPLQPTNADDLADHQRNLSQTDLFLLRDVNTESLDLSIDRAMAHRLRALLNRASSLVKGHLTHDTLQTARSPDESLENRLVYALRAIKKFRLVAHDFKRRSKRTTLSFPELDFVGTEGVERRQSLDMASPFAS